jgi:hypothetical protein
VKKADSLKALLLKAVKPLADNPENLSLFVDRGRIGHRASDRKPSNIAARSTWSCRISPAVWTC